MRAATKKRTSSGSRSGHEVPNQGAGADATAPLNSIGTNLWRISAWLFGMLLSWAFLAPQDATSCFVGDAQAQNLFWLLSGVCAATGAAIVGSGIRLPSWERWLLVSCIGWLIFVSWRAGFDTNPRTAWFGFWQCMALATCYYVGRGLLQGSRCRAAALQVCLIGCYATAVVGLYQVMIEFPQARAQYAADPEEFLQRAGIDAPPGSPLRKRFEDRLASPEPHATFALANSLAVVLSAGLILALGIAGTVFQRTTLLFERWPQKSILLFGIALIGSTWFLTLSRTAYLAVLFALALWGLQAVWSAQLKKSELAPSVRQRSLKSVRRAAIAVLFFVVAGGIWLLLNDRFVLSEAGKSLAFRLDYWRATWRMLLEHGWRGVGLGNFQSFYPTYMLPTASETIADPHNWLLDIAATLSIPMATIICVWLFWQLLSTGPRVRAITARRPDADSEASGSILRSGLEHSDRLANVEMEKRDTELAKWFIWGAGFGGAICLLLLVLLSGFDLASLLVAALVAVALGWRTRPLLMELQSKPAGALRAAAVAMLVCLLASGSWQATGIAVPLLILLLCLRPTSVAAPSHAPLGVRDAVLTVALPVAGVVAFIFQSWMPVTASWAYVQQATVARGPNEQLELARLAQRADPLDSDRAQFVAQLLIARAINESADLFPRAATTAWEAIVDWLERDTANYLNWQFAGDRALEMAARAELAQTSQIKYLRGAADFYRMAIARHPTNCQLHLQLATVLAVQERWEEAQTELAIAVQLSDQTPHQDKKLEAQQIWLPRTPSDLQRFLELAPPPTDGWCPAEPVSNWIRNAGASP